MFSPTCPTDLDLAGRVPVVLIHGFVSDRSTWNSMRARLARDHSGAQVFTFDYSAHNTDWVTSESIAHVLALGIRCLGEHSPTGKVAVIAHSMGGLALRCAAANSCSRVAGVPARLGLVVTLGTPHLGSEFLAQWRVEPSKTRPKLGCTGRVLAVGCETLQEVRSKVQRALPVDSDASRAMLPDSSELAELPPFDPNVPVVALAADVRRGIMLFQLPVTPEGSRWSMGDLVVPVGSATAYSTTPGIVVDCGVVGPRLLGIDHFGLPWEVRCHHLNMTTSEPFLTKVSGEIGQFLVESNS